MKNYMMAVVSTGCAGLYISSCLDDVKDKVYAREEINPDRTVKFSTKEF